MRSLFGVSFTIILSYHNSFKEPLINCLCGMKRKAHGTQKPRHINRIAEAASAAQRSDSPAQAINQRFLKRVRFSSVRERLTAGPEDGNKKAAYLSCPSSVRNYERGDL